MSHLAANVIHFTRLLRGAGLKLGPASALDALAAVGAVDLFRRDEFHAALRATLVRRPEDFDLFDQAFRLFWRDPMGPEAALALLLPRVKMPQASLVSRRLAEAWKQPAAGPQPPPPEKRDFEAAFTFASEEALRSRDFEQMSAEELTRAKKAVARMALSLRPVRTRRYAPDPHGRHLDLARTAKDSQKTFGDLAPLRYREKVALPPPVVVLCDISGSMGRYSEVLLHYLHALCGTSLRVEVFLFATRLTPITRFLRKKDPDLALARCGREVLDWQSGTRLRACLREFNRKWSRRVLGRGAVVLLVTDGLDRDPEPGLDAETERLHKSSRRLIWLNPLLRWDGFEPKAQGVKALLPHVDEHRPVHNLESLEALGRALG